MAKLDHQQEQHLLVMGEKEKELAGLKKLQHVQVQEISMLKKENKKK